MRRNWLLPVIGMMLLPAHAFGWGDEGHKAIARNAQSLAKPETIQKVQQILGVSNWEDAATWADDIRGAARGQGPYADHNTPAGLEAAQVNTNFPKNSQWHYVNLPLGVTGYNDPKATQFENENDIVHAINLCINVIKGRQPAGVTMTKAEALRFIIHFTGDIHMPMHVVNGWYSIKKNGEAKFIKYPSSKSLIEDRGANQLFYTKTQELHAFWDNDLVNDIKKHNGTIDSTIRPLIKSRWTPSGDDNTWASSWASDTLKAGRAAYKNLKYGKVTYDDKNHAHIPVILPANYEVKMEPLAAQQLAKASYRLAKLLDDLMKYVQ